jgi:Uma2 family endonuclease
MSVHAGLITVEEYLKLPDPKEGHTELHHGQVVLTPPAKRGHQRRQRRILSLLTRVLGHNASVETEMAFRPAAEYEVWQTDVAYISSAREHTIPDDAYITGAPDLVVEILSPSNSRQEINDKMAICLNNGCVSFWVVDPKRKRVSVTEGNVTRHYDEVGIISCSLFSGQIQVGEIFE